MASYVPLIIDTALQQIGQLPINNDLDLTGSNILNVPGIVFANGNIDGNVTYVGGNLNLGPIANVHLQGGAAGAVLQTDGTGNLNWSAFTPKTIINGQSNVLIPSANANINFTVNAAANIVSISSNALTVNGNAYATNFVGTLANGNSNITILANSAVGISVTGQSNVLLLTSSGSKASSTFSDDLTVTGNLTVLGSTTTVTTGSLAVQTPIIEEGGGANGSILTSQDAQDRGILMHTYGNGTTKTTTALVASGSTTIPLNNTTGLVAGMFVTYPAAAAGAVIPTSAVINTVNPANIVISTSTVGSIPNGATLAIGTNLDRGLFWNYANSEFTFGSNVIDTLNTITYNQLGNVRAQWFIAANGISALGNLFTNGNANVTSNVNAGNLVGPLANGNSKITIAANANITLTSKSGVVANVVSSGDGNLQTTGVNVFGYLNATGNVIAPNLVGVLANGNSNVTIASNANVTVNANGNVMLTITSSGDGNLITTGANLTGYLRTTGNLTAPNLIGIFANGNSNINIPAANGNINFSTTGNANVLILSGNATASQAIFAGNANVSGNLHIANGNYARFSSTSGIWASFRASPDSANFTANYTITLPVNNGANNQWLMVDGGGNLRFSNTFVRYSETVVAGGTVSGALAPDLNTGTIFRYTLNGAITINAMGNPATGSSFIIVLTQDSTGGRTATWGSNWLFSGGSKTLSVPANSVDVVAGFYDGTNYYATLTRGFA